MEALKSGAKPKQVEVELWRQAWINSALRDEGDADAIPGYLITEITGETGAPLFALILCTELQHSFEGIFESAEAAKEYMRESGWIS